MCDAWKWFEGLEAAQRCCELYLPYLVLCCHDRSTMFHPLRNLSLVHMGKARDWLDDLISCMAPFAHALWVFPRVA